jgi:hypothetical protein
VEKLLPDHYDSTTVTFSTTDADASNTASANKRTQDRAKQELTTTLTIKMPRATQSQSTSPWPRSIKICSKKNPEEGERYQKLHICKICKTFNLG